MIWIAFILRYLIVILLFIFLCWTIPAMVGERRRGKKTERQKKPALVVLTSGDGMTVPGTKWEIGNQALIGREPDCLIRLGDPFVSGRHARVYSSRGHFYVEDLGSTNGTLLNDHPLHGSARLNPGERLQIGKVAFTIYTGQDASEYQISAMLTAFPGFLLAAGGLALFLNHFISWQQLSLALLVAIFLAVSALIFRIRGLGDSYFFLVVGVLTAIGLIFLYRINPVYGIRQSYWVLTGLAIFWLTQIFLRNYRRLLDYKYLFMALSLLFLILTIIVGTTAGGARSWLSLGSFRFQPSELVKVFMVIFLAGYLDEYKEILTQGTIRIGMLSVPDWPYLGPLLLACGLSLVLLVMQKDLGMALLFFTIFMAMVYAATGRESYLVGGMALFIIGALAMYMLFPHVQERIIVYRDPWRLASSGGYQIVQSLFALSGGGIWGWGLGGGFPQLIPAVHTDFIFSLVGEELGLVGALGMLTLYAILIWRGMLVALKCGDSFGKLLAFGFSSLLALQTLIILGGVSNAIPLTGIPLPFLSYGGSSFVSNCFLVGIIMKISAHVQDERRQENEYV